jgi:RHS repeat-associated protein
LFYRFFLAALLFFQFSAAVANLGFTPKSIATQAINTLASADITTYDPADNLLRVFEDKRYFYDGHGRLLVKKSGRHQTQYFEWDDSHQLQAVHTVRVDNETDTDKAKTKVSSTRFTYDPLGRRTSKTHHDSQQASTTRFAWDGLKLLSETKGDKTSLYIYADVGSYEPLARVDTRVDTRLGSHESTINSIAAQAINMPANDDIFYFHNDLNGLPQELSQDGQFVWRASYKVWGNVVSEEWTGSYAKTKTETQNLRFQGQYYDVETGLHYNTFRFYDPDIGRFTSPDPIGLNGGSNLYAYAPNSIRWVDPLGWSPIGIDPNSINFSQSWVSPNDYAEVISKKGWIGDPLNVMERDGKLVSFDNRRLDAARQLGMKEVPAEMVKGSDPYPKSTTGKTWNDAFNERLNRNGLGQYGTSERPAIGAKAGAERISSNRGGKVGC